MQGRPWHGANVQGQSDGYPLPGGSTSGKRVSSHLVFKTGRAGQPPAWKVRFLRRVVDADSGSSRELRPPSGRKGDPLRWVSTGQRRPSYWPRRSPSRSPERTRRGAKTAIGRNGSPARVAIATERRSFTPEVAGSSSVAPVSRSEPDCASIRAFVLGAKCRSRHHKSSKVNSRQKSCDQNGDHERGANAPDLP